MQRHWYQHQHGRDLSQALSPDLLAGQASGAYEQQQPNQQNLF